ncbi:hypothetical protein MNBD_GAMMA20-2452 [hydrothermal vent metagenome]|uniref:Uncharacterized protein n=1 Tax=hydrothermal vent metagenome TaxID=652676 RepID=A0A3B1BJU0_9ZZZZ
MGVVQGFCILFTPLIYVRVGDILIRRANENFERNPLPCAIFMQMYEIVGLVFRIILN